MISALPAQAVTQQHHQQQHTKAVQKNTLQRNTLICQADNVNKHNNMRQLRTSGRHHSLVKQHDVQLLVLTVK